MVSGPWTSVLKRSTLAQLDETPEFGYTYAYQLPTDPFCLKVFRINETTPGDISHQIEGSKLLCNEPSVQIRYIGRVVETEDYDSLLRRAIVSRLASELAYAITGDKTLAASLESKYKQDLMECLAINGQQGSLDRTSSDDLIDVR